MTGAELKIWREKQGLTLSQLARQLQVHVNLVVDWENDQRFPTKKHSDALRALRNAGVATSGASRQ